MKWNSIPPTLSLSTFPSLLSLSITNSHSAISLSFLACFSADFLLDSTVDYCSACISSYINRKSQKHQENTKSGTLVPDITHILFIGVIL